MARNIKEITMRVIVIDDNAKNLEAARTAASEFQGQHEFIFETSAAKALDALEQADAVVTDLFFPPEDDARLAAAYEEYVERVEISGVICEVRDQYYDGSDRKIDTKRRLALALMHTGTMRTYFEELLQMYQNDLRRDPDNGWKKSEAEKYAAMLAGDLPQQFPYGGTLMVKAHRLGKKLVLITDLHRHGGGSKKHTDAVDGMILLLPLMEDGIITIEQAKYDGHESLSYVGSDQMLKGEGRQSKDIDKTDPFAWTIAFNKLFAQ